MQAVLFLTALEGRLQCHGLARWLRWLTEGDLVPAMGAPAVGCRDSSADLAQPRVQLLDGGQELALFVGQQEDFLNEIIEICGLDAEACQVAPDAGAMRCPKGGKGGIWFVGAGHEALVAHRDARPVPRHPSRRNCASIFSPRLTVAST